MTTARTVARALAASLLLLLFAVETRGDDYAVAEGNKSLLVALGCFWCAEQAFEQYAPGVVEAVSGYAGADGIENPTYRNHPGHYEVILVEYDPSKTSYSLLVEYAFRNLDPFDTRGQFCDKGPSYLPAIFYASDEEKAEAEDVLEQILMARPDWDPHSIAVPILERPKFWTAEGYHQGYYIENPRNYGYYKNACKRTSRLKAVWGEEEYACYHDEEATCFGNVVINEEGVEVEAVTNVKDAPEETAGLMPRWAILLVSAMGGVLVLLLILYCCRRSIKNEP